MIWWWNLEYKDGWTPDSVIKFGCEVNIRSIHEEEDSNICVGLLITWYKPNCDEQYVLLLVIVATRISDYSWLLV